MLEDEGMCQVKRVRDSAEKSEEWGSEERVQYAFTSLKSAAQDKYSLRKCGYWDLILSIVKVADEPKRNWHHYK